ncbi:type II toxin-antitoxin system ParD family antitoxin [Methylobacterium sp. 17Sr1-1]|nr:type II toxin-antitoxin system ParD family antitoxin [Methylobacterium sp. 17Sr1-1]
MTVSITPELRRFIRERLHSGHYGNASEVVRAALRLMIEQDRTANHPIAPVASKSSDL